LTGIVAIASGYRHCLALQTHGSAAGDLWAWGHNGDAELGDGSTNHRLWPVRVAEQVSYLGTGWNYSIVRKADGSVLGSGLNDRGQLGDGTILSPRYAFGPALVGVPGLEKADGGAHTLALTEDGTVWATGENNGGQLGDGSSISRSNPARAAILRDVVDVAAAHFAPSTYFGTTAASVALTSDGQVWTWGSNYYGQLGTGGGTNDSLQRPQPVEGVVTADLSWPHGDPDGDGLLTEEELRCGTDPFVADSNGDGISDLVAVRSGLSAVDPDMDDDGVWNAIERTKGTDPLRADTDADGVGDGVDCFALDPSRSSCPVPSPGDVVPPVITLTEPTNASLISSAP
jgi:hypothetical protein